MSKLYLVLPFLLLVQEFHHTLGYLSYPLVQDFLGILEDLGEKKYDSKRGLISYQWPNVPVVCNSGKGVRFSEL